MKALRGSRLLRWLGKKPGPKDRVNLRMCTVFDDRPNNPLRTLVMAANTLLLAASHKQQELARHPLMITAVSPRRTVLLRRLEEFGATIIEAPEPHALFEYSGTYNKLLALRGQDAGESALLLDNDIVLLGDLSAVEHDLCEYTMAGYADRELADAKTREEIASALGLSMLDGQWMPWRDRYENQAAGKPPVNASKLYFNSGVVSSPAAADLHNVWDRHSRLICKHFGAQHADQRQRHAFGSDQLSFATAVTEINRFKLLPEAYNYRAFNFMRGDLKAAEIRIVHQVGISRYMKMLENDERMSLSRTVQAYYDRFMHDRVRGDNLDHKQERLAVIESTRDRVLEIVRSCDIDDLREYVH